MRARRPEAASLERRFILVPRIGLGTMNAAPLLFGQVRSSISMKSRLLAAIWLSSFLVSLDYSAVNVALPTLAREFNVGTSDVAWVALSYQTVVVALTLMTGAASSRIGYLRALAWSLGLFAVASLASAVSSTLWALVGMRILQGVGASVMFAIDQRAGVAGQRRHRLMDTPCAGDVPQRGVRFALLLPRHPTRLRVMQIGLELSQVTAFAGVAATLGSWLSRGRKCHPWPIWR